MPHSGQQNDFTSKISLCTGFCLFWPGFGQGLYGLCYFGLALIWVVLVWSGFGLG